MPPLADVQAAIAAAMLTGNPDLAPKSLTGGSNARARLGIHLRHYAASLQTALLDKFPATRWLLGGQLVEAATAAYVRAHPPQAPCIAEYGTGFPAFVARFERAAELDYAEPFANLEWALGQASIAVDEPQIAWRYIVEPGPDRLLGSRLVMQNGLSYVRAVHAVDTLMELYLTGEEPETFELPACDTPIEVHGSRGSLRMTRLTPGTFEFRDALRAGKSIGDAAERALDAGGGFDAGKALRELVDAGLIVSIRPRGEATE